MSSWYDYDYIAVSRQLKSLAKMLTVFAIVAFAHAVGLVGLFVDGWNLNLIAPILGDLVLGFGALFIKRHLKRAADDATSIYLTDRKFHNTQLMQQMVPPNSPSAPGGVTPLSIRAQIQSTYWNSQARGAEEFREERLFKEHEEKNLVLTGYRAYHINGYYSAGRAIQLVGANGGVITSAIPEPAECWSVGNSLTHSLAGGRNGRPAKYHLAANRCQCGYYAVAQLDRLQSFCEVAAEVTPFGYTVHGPEGFRAENIQINQLWVVDNIEIAITAARYLEHSPGGDNLFADREQKQAELVEALKAQFGVPVSIWKRSTAWSLGE